MNAILLLCRQCRRIHGCSEPTRKSCATCVSHDCPLLPAPERVDASCALCGPPPSHQPKAYPGWFGSRDTPSA